MNRKRLIVIGGNAAGMSAASNARRHNQNIDVVVFERGAFTSYSICGLPYYVSNVVDDIHSLVVRTPEKFREKLNIDVRILHEIIDIDVQNRRVCVRRVNSAGQWWESFDLLMIANGAIPNRPNLPGADAGGIYDAHSMQSGIVIKDLLDRHCVLHAVVVGGGYIGLEMAEALMMRGVDVSLIEASPQVMGTMDADMAALVADEIVEKKIHLYTDEPLQEFYVRNHHVSAVVTSRRTLPADLVILGLGVRPDTRLAERAGISLGTTAAISVNDRMQTSVDSIWAAGDCVETFHLISRQPVHMALATAANKQGRIAGLNIAGKDARFRGVLGTAITKFCSLEISRTGLHEKEIQKLGIEYVTGKIRSYALAAYYPEADRMTVKILAEKKGGRLLGGQIVGKKGAAKRIDTLATALQAGMTVSDMVHLDLSYAPPFSLTWDPVAVAARRTEKNVEAFESSGSF